jgi:hypothetical protein
VQGHAIELCLSLQSRWVYDCPDFEEFNIFYEDGKGNAGLDAESLKQADEHGVSIKNSRDDRFTLVMIPEETVQLPSLLARSTVGPDVDQQQFVAQRSVVEEQAITMTRSLGDFYAHRHGLTWQPDVRIMPLTKIMHNKWQHPLLMLASDGVWDLWGFDEVSEQLVSPRNALSSATMRKRADSFFETTRNRGQEWFDESADNLTGVLVDLSPALNAITSMQDQKPSR